MAIEGGEIGGIMAVFSANEKGEGEGKGKNKKWRGWREMAMER